MIETADGGNLRSRALFVETLSAKIPYLPISAEPRKLHHLSFLPVTIIVLLGTYAIKLKKSLIESLARLQGI
jgi:hypothetical protein